MMILETMKISGNGKEETPNPGVFVVLKGVKLGLVLEILVNPFHVEFRVQLSSADSNS